MSRTLTHGTAYGYRVLGCRCDDCRIAARDLLYRWRERVAGQPAEHGTLNGYNNYSCRCEPCSAAHAAYLREYRART